MGKLKFSVVIAVAPERKAEVLNSLKKVKYPKKKYEIIIERGLNPSENRNKGFKKSRGEIIAFIDDDAVVDPEILKKAESFFEVNKDIDIAGGPQITPLDERGFAKISGYALSSIFGTWKIANRYSGKKTMLDADETMLTSANLFCRKEVFKRVKFNPALFPGEDPKFIEDAKKQGFKVAYFPELVVYHRRRQTLGKLIKQIYTYGKTRPRKENFKETLKMPFFIIPSVFLIYLLAFLAIIISSMTITGNIIGMKSGYNNLIFIFSIPLVLYVILNLSFSMANSITNKDFVAFFILPLIYMAIHLSYGTGFIYGIFTKKKSRKNEVS